MTRTRPVRARRWGCLASGSLWALGVLPAAAQMAHQHHHKAERSGCRDASLACASTATPPSPPTARCGLPSPPASACSSPVPPISGAASARPQPSRRCSPGPQQLDWGPDARPKIVVDKDGRISVAYAIFKDKAFNGQVFFTQSTDQGRSFAPPRPITSDTESQRFEVLALDPAGRLFTAWLDKRNRPQARAKGQKYMGAALAYAWIDGGETIGEATLAVDNTCECCRIGVGFAGAGRPVLLFRNIFGGSVRDHAVITFADASSPGPAMRVSNDDWRTDACPHHGPALAVSRGGTYHAAWFTNGRARQGLFSHVPRTAGTRSRRPCSLGLPSGSRPVPPSWRCRRRPGSPGRSSTARARCSWS